MSLDEAKKITAKFEGQFFTPPPKTIEDITRFLEQQPNVGPSVIAKNRAAANHKRPPGLTGDDLVQFLYERALAANEVGLAKRRSDELREVERLTRGQRGTFRWDVLTRLSSAEMGTGDRYKVLSYRKKSVDNAQINFKKIFELGFLAKN